MNGDGRDDIIIASVEIRSGEPFGFLHCLGITSAAGGNTLQELPGWPVYAGKFAKSSPFPQFFNKAGIAVGDVDGDGAPEIVAQLSIPGFWMFPPPDPGLLYLPDSSYLYVFEKDGSIRSYWPREITGCRGGFSLTEPVLADLDGDGDLEIIAASYRTLTAWQDTGEIMSGWPVLTGFGSYECRPVMGDLDLDGHPEILIKTTLFDGHMLRSRVSIWKSDGSVFSPPFMDGKRFSEEYIPGPRGEPSMATPLCIADIDGDARPDVVAGSEDGKIYAWKQDGSLVNGYPFQLAYEKNLLSAALEDLDNDGVGELVLPTFASSGRTCRTYVIEQTGYGLLQWPMFGHDIQHTNAFAVSPTPLLLSPSGFTTELIPEFRWEVTGSQAAGLTYELWVSEIGGSSNPVIHEFNISKTSWQTGKEQALTPGKSYNWWVRTWQGEASGPWSQPLTFTVAAQQSSLTESFEQGWGLWMPDNDGRAPEFRVELSQDQAYDGNHSVMVYIDGSQDDGTAWVERAVNLNPNKTYKMHMRFWVWSAMRGDVNQWPVVAYGGLENPKEERNFSRIGNTDEVAGWKQYSYSTNITTDASGIAYIASGISCVWETELTYYIDLIEVSFSEI